MEKWDKRDNAEVDSILYELKRDKGKAESKVDDADLENILAGLGIGAKVQQEAAKTQTSASQADPAPQEQPPVPQKQAPAAAAEELPQEPDVPEEEAEKAPAPQARAKRTDGRGTIWDVEIERGPVQPRVGKAAALDKVDPEKFTSETELLSWFSPEEEGLSRKERKRLEKEEKLRQKQILRQEKAQRKYGYEAEEDEWNAGFAELSEPEEAVEEELFPPEVELPDDLFADQQEEETDGLFTDPQEETPAEYHTLQNIDVKQAIAQKQAGDVQYARPRKMSETQSFQLPEEMRAEKAPLWEAVKQDDVVTGSAFDEGLEEDNWPEEGSLFDAVENAPPEQPSAHREAEERQNTQTYSIEGEDEAFARVPTAAFTQEFEIDTADPTLFTVTKELQKSLFVEDMVDDRFRDFFSETIIVDKGDIEEEKREKKWAKRRNRKKNRTLVTGEFAQLARDTEWPDETEEEFADEYDFEDYNQPQDAKNIEQDLAQLKRKLLIRSGVTLGLALLMAWQALAALGLMGMPGFVSPALHPMRFAMVYIFLVVAAIVVNFTTVASGLVGLFREPTGDCGPALAIVATLLQSVVVLVQYLTNGPMEVTLFGAVAALLLAGNTFGKFVRARSIAANFQLASAGFDHSAAYVLDSGHELSYAITRGLEEEYPNVLVSRPTALVKGFMRQSFSQRWSDRIGRILGWVLFGVAGFVGVVAFVQTKEMLQAVSSAAAVLCLGVPLSSTLVSAVPSLLLQQTTTKVGAVVPGWSAIEELGEVNTVMATAKDVFPASSVQLHGIKTFEKERIDLAILYAASVLIEGCDTMRDLFSAVIQGKNDMLYEVESLTTERGRGFTAWVNKSRVVIGTREMLQKHDVAPPPMEVEMKYASGDRLPMYLAVAGKLYAMFIVSYNPDEQVQETLDGLVKSGVSLLVTSNDMNVNNERIEQVYQLPPGVVKVLGPQELEMLEPLTEYRDESEGVMTHIGSFASFIGGMRAAAGCAASERMAGILQIAAVVLASLLGILLVFSGTLAGLSMGIVLIYQLAWTLMVSAVPLARRY